MDTRNTNERSEIAGARRPDADWERPDRRRAHPPPGAGRVLGPARSPRAGAESAPSPRRWPSCRSPPPTTRRTRRPPTTCWATICRRRWRRSRCRPRSRSWSACSGTRCCSPPSAYQLGEPGHPGIAIHTDAQPYGSRIFGSLASSPVLMRVLYYLDDLTPECSPFKVVPRSHLSVHVDANPYNRFLRHDEEVMVTCDAGLRGGHQPEGVPRQLPQLLRPRPPHAGDRLPAGLGPDR